MKNFHARKLVLIVPLLLSSCATSSYRISKTQGMKAELAATPDRVIPECAKVSDENELYMFLVHVLDEENTVSFARSWEQLGERGVREPPI